MRYNYMITRRFAPRLIQSVLIAPLDTAQMFAKISRALRLTATLELKTAEKLRALVDGVAAEQEARREETAKRAAASKRSSSATRRSRPAACEAPPAGPLRLGPRA
jgi:hypothetical protein